MSLSDFGSIALRRLLDEHADAVLATHAHRGDATALVERGALARVLRFLRDDPACGFAMLADLCAVDYLGMAGDTDAALGRFEVVYHLLAPETLARVRVKARVPADAPEASSVCAIWPAANWMEREVFDLYGIRFAGHPDLRRLLLYDEFEGHPLRKDYPKTRRQPLIGPGG
ncbi:MAG: NADH-quinone oxidoreductase subunit C [Myxococcota bacterium]